MEHRRAKVEVWRVERGLLGALMIGVAIVAALTIAQSIRASFLQVLEALALVP